MCSDDESPMPSHRKCKNITKVFPYKLENMIYIVSKRKKLDSTTVPLKWTNRSLN